MTRHRGAVRLESNGDYWTAVWSGSRGTRKRKSLGAKSTLSRREALARCRELGAEMMLAPGKRDGARAPTLGEWCRRYFEVRAGELSEGTEESYRDTADRLKEHFGAEVKIDRITREDAADWRVKLGKRKKGKGKKAKPITEQTVRKHLRQARAIFGAAVEFQVLFSNPFTRQRSGVQEPEKDWPYIDGVAMEKILAACPDDHWRTLVNLCRWAGLRRNEALGLKWADIDWDARTARVSDVKRSKVRVVPLAPVLHDWLLERFHDERADKERCCPVGTASITQRLERIVRASGVAAYSKPFHTLRKNCESDWLAQHPAPAVCEWIGNSIRVAMKHYHKPTPETIRAVTGAKCQKTAKADPLTTASPPEASPQVAENQ